MIFELDLAGQRWKVDISKAEIEKVHIPVVRWCMAQQKAQSGRFVVFLSGPPGSGKSTVAALWERLAGDADATAATPARAVAWQALPMDGFHFTNNLLTERTVNRDGIQMPLSKIKGAPETFDLESLVSAIEQVCDACTVTWPLYDRQIHNPVPEALPVIRKGVIVIEGNYLLLDEPKWRDLGCKSDLRIFLECTESVAKERIISRALRSGRSRGDAEAYFEFTDKYNYERVMKKRKDVDMVFSLDADGVLKHIIDNAGGNANGSAQMD